MEKSFEENLKDLEKIVRDLENKDISLDDAVKKYKEGLTLSKGCYEQLQKNEEVIVNEMENNKLKEFKR